jgi:hypothetical protein
MTEIAKAIHQMATYAVRHKTEYRELYRRCVEAMNGPDTPENLRERSSCWARAERLWNGRDDPKSPESPKGPKVSA